MFAYVMQITIINHKLESEEPLLVYVMSLIITLTMVQDNVRIVISPFIPMMGLENVLTHAQLDIKIMDKVNVFSQVLLVQRVINKIKRADA